MKILLLILLILIAAGCSKQSNHSSVEKSLVSQLMADTDSEGLPFWTADTIKKTVQEWVLLKSDTACPFNMQKVDTIYGKFFRDKVDTLFLTRDIHRVHCFDDFSLKGTDPNAGILNFRNMQWISMINEGDLDGDGYDDLGCLCYTTGSASYADMITFTYKEGWKYLYNPANFYEWVGLTDVPFDDDSLVSKTQNKGVLRIRYFDYRKDTPQDLSDMVDSLIQITPHYISDHDFLDISSPGMIIKKQGNYSFYINQESSALDKLIHSFGALDEKMDEFIAWHSLQKVIDIFITNSFEIYNKQNTPILKQKGYTCSLASHVNLYSNDYKIMNSNSRLNSKDRCTIKEGKEMLLKSATQLVLGCKEHYEKMKSEERGKFTFKFEQLNAALLELPKTIDNWSYKRRRMWPNASKEKQEELDLNTAELLIRLSNVISSIQ